MENIAVKNKNGNWYYIYKTNWRDKKWHLKNGIKE